MFQGFHVEYCPSFPKFVCISIKHIMKFLYAACIFCMLNITSAGQSPDYVTSEADFREPVTAVDVSPDGNWILAGFENGTLRVLDAKSLAAIFTLEEAGPAAVFDIEMSPAMDVIFLASGNRIILFDTTGTKITSWSHHKNTMWSMDINKQGTYMVSTEVNKTFQLTNVYEGRIEQAMRGHDDVTFAVAFSPDGTLIASGSNDRKVFLWDLESREVIATFQGISDNIYDVAFSPDGKNIAAASADNSVRIWDIGSGELTLLLKGHQEMVLEIEFSPDGRYLLSASADQAIKLWDLASGEQLYAYLENEASIPDIEFLPDVDQFVSACMDGKLRIRRIDPEIFVMKYYRQSFLKEIDKNPLFLPKQKGEKRSDFKERQSTAENARKELVRKYYKKYLEAYKKDPASN